MKLSYISITVFIIDDCNIEVFTRKQIPTVAEKRFFNEI